MDKQIKWEVDDIRRRFHSAQVWEREGKHKNAMQTMHGVACDMHDLFSNRILRDDAVWQSVLRELGFNPDQVHKLLIMSDMQLADVLHYNSLMDVGQ